MRRLIHFTPCLAVFLDTISYVIEVDMHDNEKNFIGKCVKVGTVGGSSFALPPNYSYGNALTLMGFTPPTE